MLAVVDANQWVRALHVLYLAVLARCCARRQPPPFGAAGGAAPPAASPAAAPIAAPPSAAAGGWPTLLDVIGFVALNGYAREANACAGLCRETWRCIPAGLSAADADRVRRGSLFWHAIIDLKHGKHSDWTRLMIACRNGDFDRVRELCQWGADVNKEGFVGRTALTYAAMNGEEDCVVELLAHGADVNASNDGPGRGETALIMASACGHVEVVRALLAAGANKRIRHDGMVARGIVGMCIQGGLPAKRAAVVRAIKDLLDAAP
jgi:hypothetical protein